MSYTMSWERNSYSWDNYYEDNAELFSTPEVETDPLDLTEISFSEVSLDEMTDEGFDFSDEWGI